MNKRIPIFIGCFFIVIAIWLQVASLRTIEAFITRVENLAYDMQLRTRLLASNAKYHGEIAIVDIDDKSVSKEGRWPWPRSKLAKITSVLQEAGAVVVVFDMFFSAPENNIVDEITQTLNQKKLITLPVSKALNRIDSLFNNDAIFAESIKKIDTALGLSFLPRKEEVGVLPQPILQLHTPAEKKLGFIIAQGYIGEIPILENAAKSIGFVNVFSDVDGIIRRVPVLIRYQDNVYPSLALEAVRLYLLSNIELITAPYADSLRLEGVRLGNHIIPTDAKAQVIVPFRGGSYTYPYYSATDVIAKKFPANAFEGKIVFVGTSATGLGDLKATAIESSFPGVEIQAAIADGILTDNFSYKPPWTTGAEIFLTFVLGALCTFIFPYLGPRLISLIMLALPIALFFGNNLLWEQTGLIISVFIPVFLILMLAIFNMIYGYLFETRRREHLKEIFGQYVPAKHIDEMLATSGASSTMLGESREMTVLFADIRDFTSISEHFSAIQIKEILNEFFTPMTEIIFKYHGTIDKYVGDLIMAFWGAPLKDKHHSYHAIATAIDMQKKIKELQPYLVKRNWPNLQMGVGLNSGSMNVGDMGSKFRRNYTVLGDAVNLASRIESLTKFYSVGIIVTEATQLHNEKNFIFRQLDRVRVKGKEEGIAIYEVLGRKENETDALKQKIFISNQALHYYYDQQWERARTLFTELNTAHPEKFYQIYLARIEEFVKNPPPKDWDGIYTMQVK